MILTRKAFETLARKSLRICIPVQTGKKKESWQYVEVDKESFLRSLEDTKVSRVNFDEPCDFGDGTYGTIWINTPAT